jgi:hypothetical protein
LRAVVGAVIQATHPIRLINRNLADRVTMIRGETTNPDARDFGYGDIESRCRSCESL